MSKAHRGKGIRELFAHGRGECPVCKRTNIKVLYEQEAGGQKFKICKICKAAIKNGNKKLPVTVEEQAPVAAESSVVAAPVAETKPPVETEPPAEVAEQSA